MTKTSLILVFIFLRFSAFYGQGSKWGLQTSDIFELHKGKKGYKAIFAGDKITIYENYKTSKDTLFVKAVTGSGILFTHDSINRHDSIIIKALEITNYYIVKIDKSTKTINQTSVTSNEILKIPQANIIKIKRGRRTYKMRPDKVGEKVWTDTYDYSGT